MKVKIKKINPDGYVSRAAFEQVRWEKDVAMQQLEELGVPFGAKTELYAKPIVHARWETVIEEADDFFEADLKYPQCSNCKRTVLIADNFCPYCGAQMDEVIE